MLFSEIMADFIVAEKMQRAAGGELLKMKS